SLRLAQEIEQPNLPIPTTIPTSLAIELDLSRTLAEGTRAGLSEREDALHCYHRQQPAKGPHVLTVALRLPRSDAVAATQTLATRQVGRHGIHPRVTPMDKPKSYPCRLTFGLRKRGVTCSGPDSTIQATQAEISQRPEDASRPCTVAAHGSDDRRRHHRI